MSWRSCLNPAWTTNLDPIQTHHSLTNIAPSALLSKDELLKISVVIQANLELVFS